MSEPKQEISMSDMVERVALAIFKADNTDLITWENHAEEWKKVAYRNKARVAIEAMREPTQAMIVYGADGGTGEHITSWQRMIDAALGKHAAKD